MNGWSQTLSYPECLLELLGSTDYLHKYGCRKHYFEERQLLSSWNMIACEVFTAWYLVWNNCTIVLNWCNILLLYQPKSPHTGQKLNWCNVLLVNLFLLWNQSVSNCIIKINWSNILLPNLLFLSTPCLGSQTSVDNAKIKPTRLTVEIKMQSKL